ncbi:MAG: hypothetical protein IPK93_09365 [Solirubrobacterales bacterium]|nr:hypothetical protein [Solirubrobacterales bacterium]
MFSNVGNLREFGFGIKACLLAFLLMAGMVLAGASAGSASAEPVKFDLDTGIINLGTDPGTNGVKIIDPAADPAATISGEVTGTTFTGPSSGLAFPSKTLKDVQPGIDAIVNITASSGLTGTLDGTTGAGTIDIPARIQVSAFSGATLLGECTTSLALSLSTTGTLVDPGDPSAAPPRPAADYDAADFGPPAKDGAFVASWPTIPATTPGGGAAPGSVCPAVDGLIDGPGGLFLSGNGGVDEGITTTYVGDEGTTFATTAGGWTGSSVTPATCIPVPLLCADFTSSHQAADGTGGAGDGFIRTASSGTTLAALAGTTTGTWTSPAFTYNGAGGQVPDTLSFSLARKSNASSLLSAEIPGSPLPPVPATPLDITVDYGATLVKVSDNSETQLIAPAP